MSIKQRIGVFLALIILLAVPGLQAIAASAQETDVLALLEERQRAVAELMEASTVYVLLDKLRRRHDGEAHLARAVAA